jgi:hypothetical protein
MARGQRRAPAVGSFHLIQSNYVMMLTFVMQGLEVVCLCIHFFFQRCEFVWPRHD